MKLSELTTFLESVAPLALQESYDNSGLLVGDPDREIRQAMIALDCTEDVLDEAIRTGCDLIITHHPLVFKGLKTFTGANYVERALIKAIRHHIALYAAHTNLDNVTGGVNTRIADRLGLESQVILAPKHQLLRKLVVFVPQSHAEAVRQAIFDAGAGHIGNYDQCSFNSTGFGTFRAGPEADPHVGTVGQRHQEDEIRIEVLYPEYLERRILQALFSAHPYEEVAFDSYRIENAHQQIGSGMIGQLPQPLDGPAFLQLLKERLNTPVIRHTRLLDRPIERVAVCGGSGSFLLHQAKVSGADAFVTADYKYHDFFDADGKILIADVGHFESEQFTQELLLEIIQKNSLPLQSV